MNNKMLIYGLIIFLFATYSYSSDRLTLPIKEDANSIKTILLRHTPIGSSNAEVMDFVKKDLHHKSSKIIYDKNNGALPPGGKFIGTRSISIYIDEYGRSIKNLFLVSTKVYVEWGFGNDDILLDIVVIKEGDGP